MFDTTFSVHGAAARPRPAIPLLGGLGHGCELVTLENPVDVEQHDDLLAQLAHAGDVLGLVHASAEAGRGLDLFLLEKAFYEISYEAANRPSWLGIPLKGVAALLPSANGQAS